MKKLKGIISKAAAFLPALALFAGIISANSACTSFFYQTETPDAMNAYRK